MQILLAGYAKVMQCFGMSNTVPLQITEENKDLIEKNWILIHQISYEFTGEKSTRESQYKVEKIISAKSGLRFHVSDLIYGGSCVITSFSKGVWTKSNFGA